MVLTDNQKQAIKKLDAEMEKAQDSWRAGMPVLVKVKGEFRIYHAYRMITEKYADICRRMAEKEAVKARRGAVGFVPKFALYRKARGNWR